MASSEFVRVTCEKCWELVDDLSRAVADYSTLANELAVRIGTLEEADYRELRERVCQARRDAQNVRLRLCEHRAKHGATATTAGR